MSRDFWKRWAKTGPSPVASSCRTPGWSLSGPKALEVFKPLRSLVTPSSETMSSMKEAGLLRPGREVSNKSNVFFYSSMELHQLFQTMISHDVYQHLSLRLTQSWTWFVKSVWPINITPSNLTIMQRCIFRSCCTIRQPFVVEFDNVQLLLQWCNRREGGTTWKQLNHIKRSNTFISI